jgi:predicted nucleotidyltransferase
LARPPKMIESLKQLLGREIDLVTAKYLRNRFFIQRIKRD